jgi:hypothetical protein
MGMYHWELTGDGLNVWLDDKIVLHIPIQQIWAAEDKVLEEWNE